MLIPNETCIRISQAYINTDSEITQWHIDSIFQDLCGNFIKWCDENYPGDCTFFRRECIDDDYGVKLKIEWFAEFRNPEAQFHFTLVWHDNLPQNEQ